MFAEVAEYTIEEIEFKGNRLLSKEELKSMLSVRVGDPFIQSQVRKDLQKLFKTGYFNKEGLKVYPEESSEGGVKLVFDIQEQAPITDIVVHNTANLSIEVDAHGYFKDLVGKPENPAKVSKIIQDLEMAYVNKGYILTRVKDLEHRADGSLHIYISSGQIADIKYIGNNKTKAKYLNYLVRASKKGEAYNEKLFAKDYKRLQGTQYFSRISRNLKPDINSDGYILEITLEEKRTITIGAGAGINNNSGLFGNANLNFNNIRGLGESLGINAIIGSGFGANNTFESNSRLFRRARNTRIGINYNKPFIRGVGTSGSIFTNFAKGPNFMVDLSEQNYANLGTSYSKKLGGKQSLRFSTSANLIDLDEQDLDDGQDSYIKVITDSLTNAAVGTPERQAARAEAKAIRKEQLQGGFFQDFDMAYAYMDVDDPSRPRHGIRARFGLTPTLGIGDVNSFTKLRATGTKYFPVMKESSFVLHTRTGYELFGDTPLFSQYRLGGAGGVRGYRQFSDLGVGDKLAIGTAEFRTPIYAVAPVLKKVRFVKDLEWALFFDAGLVGGESKLNRLSERLSRAMSAGFGLRIRLPLVGSLRLDMAFPLLDNINGNSDLFRFNIGASRY